MPTPACWSTGQRSCRTPERSFSRNAWASPPSSLSSADPCTPICLERDSCYDPYCQISRRQRFCLFRSTCGKCQPCCSGSIRCRRSWLGCCWTWPCRPACTLRKTTNLDVTAVSECERVCADLQHKYFSPNNGSDKTYIFCSMVLVQKCNYISALYKICLGLKFKTFKRSIYIYIYWKRKSETAIIEP